MKKFEVILTNPDNGYDRYPAIRLFAPSFMDLACRLENAGVSFRCINDVTRTYEKAQYAFVPDPFPVGKVVAA